MVVISRVWKNKVDVIKTKKIIFFQFQFMVALGDENKTIKIKIY